MKKQIQTKNAPQAVGPYSQAISANGFLFISGQIPLTPDNKILENATIEEQTKLVLNNIANILKEENLTLDHIVKTEILLKDIKDFAKVNEVYKTFFNAPYPARATYEVSKLPLDSSIEIAAIATYN